MELKDLAIKPEDMRNQIVIFKHCYEISVEDAYRIAQRKLIEWLDKPCKEHPLKFTCDTSGRKFEQPEYHYRQRLHCPNCMAELKKQLGGE